jgi:hypothetical protein
MVAPHRSVTDILDIASCTNHFNTAHAAVKITALKQKKVRGETVGHKVMNDNYF